jgi:hypothetical protein
MHWSPGASGEPLYGFAVHSARLGAFCDRLQALPTQLFPTVLDGLYRPAPYDLPRVHGVSSLGSAFTDQAYLAPHALELRCTWQVRRVLEEYGFGCGPFRVFRPELARWLTTDRFVHGRSGEFWSLGYCLRRTGARPVHRCRLSRQ